jgi:hypothetical protein
MCSMIGQCDQSTAQPTTKIYIENTPEKYQPATFVSNNATMWAGSDSDLVVCLITCNMDYNVWLNSSTMSNQSSMLETSGRIFFAVSPQASTSTVMNEFLKGVGISANGGKSQVMEYISGITSLANVLPSLTNAVNTDQYDVTMWNGYQQTLILTKRVTVTKISYSSFSQNITQYGNINYDDFNYFYNFYKKNNASTVFGLRYVLNKNGCIVLRALATSTDNNISANQTVCAHFLNTNITELPQPIPILTPTLGNGQIANSSAYGRMVEIAMISGSVMSTLQINNITIPSDLVNLGITANYLAPSENITMALSEIIQGNNVSLNIQRINYQTLGNLSLNLILIAIVIIVLAIILYLATLRLWKYYRTPLIEILGNTSPINIDIQKVDNENVALIVNDKIFTSEIAEELKLLVNN